MTNLITLTIPNDDHVALRAFGKALEEMALAHGAEPRKTTVGEMTYKLNIDTTVATAALERIDNIIAEHPELEVDTTAQQVESLVQNQQPLGEDFEKVLTDNIGELYVESTPTTDSTNTSWDERIHSTSKALNADGTWRLRRKPKDMDETEWAATVQKVQDELRFSADGLTISVASAPHDADPDTIPKDEFKEVTGFVEPPVTPPGDDFHTDAGVVTEQAVAGIPPIPVPPPVVVPPVPVYDFPGLMKFLTERHGRITVEQVNALLAVDGLAALTDLNAHPDKIGPFVARVKAHLGE